MLTSDEAITNIKNRTVYCLTSNDLSKIAENVRTAHRISLRGAALEIHEPATLPHQQRQRDVVAAKDSEPITEREHDVLELLTQGCDNREIGERLCISLVHSQVRR